VSGDSIPTAALVVEAFEKLRVTYLVGGSVASALYGFPRSPNDVDLVADLRPEHAAALAAELSS
jgi:tRNA nucleotidyltransferase/poly(A) polymerase